MFTSIQTAFSAGEISPDLFGRLDLGKSKQGASTCRNFFVSYRGGATSRAGTAYVGMCKQGAPNIGGTSTDNPPRDIKFQFSLNQGYALEFGDQYLRIKSDGAYVIETGKAITGATNANPLVMHIVGHGFSDGDWVFIADMGGMTQLNGLTWIVKTVPDADHITLTDLFGNTVSSGAFGVYTSGGTASRIYTVVTPYAAIDLPYLKFTQSADTMTLCCVNQKTGTEYPSQELQRVGQTNWTLTADSFASSIAAPMGVAVSATSSTAVDTWYSYVVTAIAADNEESVASDPADVENNDIAINAGSNTVTWASVNGAIRYNIYRATPSYSVEVPVGSQYYYVGSSFGGAFTDTNITADSTKVPPVHNDPFARGSILAVNPTAIGSGYTQATVGYTVTTSTGIGLILVPIVVGGQVIAFIVENGGKGYVNTDTIAITDSGTGTGATATLEVGLQTGTYPAVPAYYQQRRAYANTTNNPDTYYMSQVGAFNNMDASDPPTDSDAIIGTPWAQQINGIQFMVPMTGGLVILSGNGAWQLTGGNNAALTPADQTATAQAYNGCNDIVPPVTVNYDILYVQAKGSIVRDLSYNFFVNIYTGTDQTVLSSHLFQDHQILQWAYAEEPYKLIWCIRDDGILLSFTYLKEQDIYAWARHDTNGLFVGVCSVTEPPVDAVYLIVKRYINGHWVYYSERMNDRLWQNVEESWCVDAGLSYPMSFPAATLTPLAAAGTNNLSSTIQISGGSNYTAPIIQAVDATGRGTGATFGFIISGGVITSITPGTQGQNYTPGATEIVISDPTGSGAKFQPVITNDVIFNASSAVFTPNSVGNVIRVGGGKATIVAYNSGTQVVGNITVPITEVIPNDPNNMPIPAVVGDWSLGFPTSVVSGLNHLEGLTVAILADGSVIPNQIVKNGTITLPAAYSQILVGLPFLPQLQSMYLDVQQPDGTMQGKRKNIQGVTVRMEQSRGMSVGTNQPDASTQPNNATVPWTNMKAFKERSALVHAGSEIPLFTGDEFVYVPGDWNTKGQIAIEQKYPLPCNVLALVAWTSYGDSAG